jgi:Ulp1 family protease
MWTANDTASSSVSLWEGLDKDERLFVSNAFSRSGDEVVDTVGLCHGGESLSVLAKDLRRFQDGELLNDECVNLAMYLSRMDDDILCSENGSRRRSHCFSSFLLPRITGGRNGFDHSSAKRWGAKVPGGDLFALEMVFIPVHVSLVHWALVVVFLAQKKVQYFDSLRNCFGSGVEYTRLVKRFLKAVAKGQGKTDLANDIGSWEVVTDQTDTPQQTGGVDCGVFVCSFVHCLLRGMSPPPFGMEEIPAIRKRMAFRILSLGST